ncbi:MAG: hypothetical protein IJM96_02305 [Clostridia bacterium]|nr:hypothetical protein [Clostridia bacterium]
MIFVFIAFIMFIVFDINKVLWNDKKLNMLFLLGCIVLVYGSYDCFIKGRSVLEIIRCLRANLFFMVLAILGMWKTYSVLFVEIPFDETYTKTGKLPLVDTGAYAVCRHPGFWFLLIAYISICKIFFSPKALIFTIFVNILNFLYICIEDAFVFPKMIYRYDDYKKRVPFLVPRR